MRMNYRNTVSEYPTQTGSLLHDRLYPSTSLMKRVFCTSTSFLLPTIVWSILCRSIFTLFSPLMIYEIREMNSKRTQ